MRYATFSLPQDPTPRVGVVNGDRIHDLSTLISGKISFVPPTVLGLIQAGPAVWKQVAALATEGLTSKASDGYASDAVQWHAPIPRPAKNIFCLGLNYVAHMEESSRARERQAKIPEVPVFFSKTPTTVIGPYDPLPWDQSATQELDHEVELGVIIGVGGKNIPRAKALEHVFGYTVINDVSARDLQKSHMQWFKGKCLDGSCPMGPVIVTADEFGDPQNKQLSLKVDADVRQNSNTKNQIFPVDITIEFLSKGMTLDAGDIIATGTPEGVGLGRIPPLYLKDGEMVEAAVEGIGSLKNRVSAFKAAN